CCEDSYYDTHALATLSGFGSALLFSPTTTGFGCFQRWTRSVVVPDLCKSLAESGYRIISHGYPASISTYIVVDSPLSTYLKSCNRLREWVFQGDEFQRTCG
ncbi:MAG: hypothetical protein ACKVK0_13895, partial [Pirellulales bacterium]